jgi:hypothetical protein
VSHVERFSRSAVENSALHHQVIEWPNQLLIPEPRIYCAYNQTRQQFLSEQVELADLPPENLREYLTLFESGSAKAFWLAPFRGISPGHVDTPIDLVFLDRNNFVLAVVESFPIAQPTSCNWPAGTALALPAQSVASSGTLAGDHLILCSPQKMKRRLLNLGSMSFSDQETDELPSNPYNIAHYLPPTRKEPVRLTNWEDVIRKGDTAPQELDTVPPAIETPQQEVAPEPITAATAVETALPPEEPTVSPVAEPQNEEEVSTEPSAPTRSLFSKRRLYGTRFRTKHQFARFGYRYR